MASNYRIASGTDLDNIFEPGNSGLTTGYRIIGGSDLGSRYASYAGGTKAAPTKFLTNGAAPVFKWSVTDYGINAAGAAAPVFTNANATGASSAALASALRASASIVGKTYFEISIDLLAGPSVCEVGFCTSATNIGYPGAPGCDVIANPNGTGLYYKPTGVIYSIVAGVLTNLGTFVGYSQGDIIGFAINVAAGKAWALKNGAPVQGNPATGTSPLFTFTAGTSFKPVALLRNVNQQATLPALCYFTPQTFNNISNLDAFTTALFAFDGPNGVTAPFCDSSVNSIPIGSTAGSISTAQSKFGGSSWLNQNSNAKTGFLSTLYGMGTADFTIEGFFYGVAFNAGPGILFGLDSGQAGIGNWWQLQPQNSAGGTQCQYVVNGSTLLATSNGSIAIGSFRHLAVVRLAGVVTVYSEGSSVGSVADATNYGTTSALLIGAYSQPTCQGYWDEVRVSVGLARYTANFTPPTGPFQTVGGNDLSDIFLLQSSPLALVASPAAVSGSAASGTATTNSTAATATGGSLSYTSYAWVKTGGDASIVATSPTAATTTFSRTVSAGTAYTATYTCTVTDSLTHTATSNVVTVTLRGSGVGVSVTPTSLSVTASGTTATTAATTATPSGGTGPYTYLWTRTSGDTFVSATSPTAASTTFSRAGIAPSATYTATFGVVATDSLAASSAPAFVTLTFHGPVPLTAMVFPTTLSASNAAGNTATTASASVTTAGGTLPLTFAWQFQSGDSSVRPDTPSASVTTFSRPLVVAGGSYTALYACVVTDSAGNFAQTTNVTVTITGVSSLSVSASPNFVSVPSGNLVTSNTTATVTGGTAPYTYLWARTGGDLNQSVSIPNNTATANFFDGRSGTSGEVDSTANFACTVTDATGASATSNTVVSHVHTFGFTGG